MAAGVQQQIVSIRRMSTWFCHGRRRAAADELSNKE